MEANYIEERRKRWSWWALVIATAVTGWGCNATKHLGEGEQLLLQSKVVLESDVIHGAERSQLVYDAGKVANQPLNRKLLGVFRTRLWAYYRMVDRYHQDTTKFNDWFMRRVAEPPSLFDSAATVVTAQKLQYFMNNKGYFDVKVENSWEAKSKGVEVQYKMLSGGALRIQSVEYDAPAVELVKVLSDTRSASLLKVNQVVSKTLFDQERVRITQSMREHGFYYFYPNYINFTADTMHAVCKIGVQIRLPEGVELRRNIVRKILIHTDYRPTIVSSFVPDTVEQFGVGFIKEQQSNFDIDLEILRQSLQVTPYTFYNYKTHQETTKRLLNLDVYKFASVKFVPIVPNNDTLDCVIYLTPAKKNEIGADLEVNTINGGAAIGDAIGLFLNLNFKNRNFLQKADRLTFNAVGGLEFAVGGSSNRLLNTLDLRAQCDWYSPRVKAPFNGANRRVSVSYNYLSRILQYQYGLASALWGYEHQFSSNARFSVIPFNVNYWDPVIDPTFQGTLDSNGFLERSFEPSLIIGGVYEYAFTSTPTRYGSNWSSRTNLEVMGNFAKFADDLFNADTSFVFGTKETSYSQYLRLDTDFRYKYRINKSWLALHFATGAAFAYGNSKDSGIPYLKQFYVGGTTSVRGWRVRDIGPGSDTLSIKNNAVPYQTGDFKIEASAEYRFDMDFVNTLVEGALFVDAGNVWSLRSGDVASRLKLDFLNEIAVSAGAGLRLDFGYFIFRTDLAWRVRLPYANYEGKRWFALPYKDYPTPFRPTWNLAIGYPF